MLYKSFKNLPIHFLHGEAIYYLLLTGAVAVAALLSTASPLQPVVGGAAWQLAASHLQAAVDGAV